MNLDGVNLYSACDNAIKAMNRENLEAFGKLKMSKWDRINIIRTVVRVYQESAKKAKRRYYGIAFEDYLLGLYYCGIEPRKAHRMADKAITNEWVQDVLEQTDFVTLYRFESETERKAYRLAETLEVSENRDRDIDRALKQWSQQLGQYAINFTDYALIQAYQDAGFDTVEWVTQKDERTCSACGSMDGETFKVDEIPRKPHMGCRCYWKAVLKKDEE